MSSGRFYINDWIEYRFYGNLHREDGPAWELDYGDEWYKEWYINDHRHRINGPAVECADGTEEWWINGVEVDKKQVNEFRCKIFLTTAFVNRRSLKFLLHR